MIAKYKINLNNFLNSSDISLNIPFTSEHELVDNSDLIKDVFINTETQKAVNPILDFEKVKFSPKDLTGNDIFSLKYVVNVIGPSGKILPLTNYSDIGFIDSDIKYRKNYFKETYLHCQFFDTDVSLSQNLITSATFFSSIYNDDIYPIDSPVGLPGQSKPASQIPVKFVLSNPVKKTDGFYEGFYIYDYKSGYSIGYPKYLYMRASFNNAKTGKSFNLVTEGEAFTIDILVKKLYTRYLLYRDGTGFYYQLDNKYSSNIKYTEGLEESAVTVNLYQIQSK